MNKRKRNLSLYILIFVFVSVSCLILSTWFTKKCLIWDCPPKRDFTVLDMNIPTGYLPSGLDIKLRRIRPIHGAIEEAQGGAEWENGHAVYIVLKFGTENQAEDWFRFESQQNFFYPNFPVSGETEGVLYHLMPNANNHQVQCGYDLRQVSRCVFYAQYKEFYIFFTGLVGDDQIPEEKFIALMDFVDLRISMLLGK